VELPKNGATLFTAVSLAERDEGIAHSARKRRSGWLETRWRPREEIDRVAASGRVQLLFGLMAEQQSIQISTQKRRNEKTRFPVR
jgi:hypothetical protein